MDKYIIEFIGTFFLVLIIGFTQNPIAIGFGVTALVYMGMHISGAHYNPAVSVAMLIMKEIDFNKFLKYVACQVMGSTFAAYVVYTISSNIIIQPNLDESIYAILIAEILFTYLLIFVILNIACNPKVEGNSFYGLAYGLTVMVGIYAVGPLSGGVFNPAVSIGPSIIDLITDGGTSQYFIWYYLTAPIIGSILAVITFNFIIKK